MDFDQGGARAGFRSVGGGDLGYAPLLGGLRFNQEPNQPRLIVHIHPVVPMDYPRAFHVVAGSEAPDKKGEGVPLPPHLPPVLDLSADVQYVPAPLTAEDAVR